MTKLLKIMRSAVLALLLAFGAATAAPIVAQDATEVPEQVTEEAQDVVEDDDDGFEWGLLGLLGLAGLAGLMRRPQPVVHEELNRGGTAGTRVGRDDDRTTI